jgi:TM2 domain-containing membrane protein YozV
MTATHKHKTLATFLAFVFGAIGAHRFYLRGSVDRLGLAHLCTLPIAGLVYGLLPEVDGFFKLLPLVLSFIIGAIEALVIGVTPDEKWDAKFNAGSGKTTQSRWYLAVLLVLIMLVGMTTMIATIARLFDLLYTGGAYG